LAGFVTLGLIIAAGGQAQEPPSEPAPFGWEVSVRGGEVSIPDVGPIALLLDSDGGPSEIRVDLTPKIPDAMPIGRLTTSVEIESTEGGGERGNFTGSFGPSRLRDFAEAPQDRLRIAVPGEVGEQHLDPLGIELDDRVVPEIRARLELERLPADTLTILVSIRVGRVGRVERVGERDWRRDAEPTRR